MRMRTRVAVQIAIGVLIAVVTTGVVFAMTRAEGADPRAADARRALEGSARAPGALADPRSGPDPASRSQSKCPADPRFPKRQLRGAWIAGVKNIDWPSDTGLSPDRQRAEYVRILDNAGRRGINAVFVHVRAASDAFYASPYEPWSEWLSGTQGKSPGWDPLPFMVAEAHRRGMEFHAWFNPYRIAYSTDLKKLATAHPARVNPGWTVGHKGKLYYNPGLPQVRDHVTKVITDVVKRYDVDGVHFDDYFYPYEGGKFADDAAFKRYGGGNKLADWRRDNVNRLVAQVSSAVHAVKGQVKFGISPFGIWRNQRTDPSGSATKGLQAYDEIYADARAWIRNGWIDYIVPQLYWSMTFKNAPYAALVPWWANEVRNTPVHLYIGQGLYRVGTSEDPAWKNTGELSSHLILNRRYPGVQGDVYFSARQLPSEAMGLVARENYARPALLPLMPRRGGKAPGPVTGLALSGGRLTWAATPGATGYAVYRVPGTVSAPGCALADASNLVAVVTGGTAFAGASAGATYFVTALDRLHHEGPAAQP